MKLRITPASVIATGAVFIAMSGTAVAASGGTFVLGRANTATTTTSLTNSAGTALSLTSKSGTAPFAVSNSTKVTRLNSDLLDGLDSTALQKKLTAACPAGQELYTLSQTGTPYCRVGTTFDVNEQELQPDGSGNGFAVVDCPAGEFPISASVDPDQGDGGTSGNDFASTYIQLSTFFYDDTAGTWAWATEVTGTGDPTSPTYVAYDGDGYLDAMCVPEAQVPGSDSAAIARTRGTSSVATRVAHERAKVRAAASR